MDDQLSNQAAPLSITAVAAAVVALSRFISASNPSLGPYLASAIDGAEKAGLSPADLQLLKILVASLS